MEEKESILIVDDDESIRRSLSLIFRKKGYETEAVGTGQEALEKAQERSHNLVLLDIKLPDMEGVELLAPIKEIHPELAVIMITAYASMDTAVQALNGGASAYITKPFNMDEVLATVRVILEMQRLVREKRRMEEELRRSEEHYRTMFNSVSDAILLINPHDYTIIGANRTALQQGKMDETEVMGKHCYEVSHRRSTPCEPPEHLCPIREMMERDSSVTVEHTHYDSKGVPFYAEVSANPVKDTAGNIVQVIHVTRNIAERKRYEKRLEALHKHAVELSLALDLKRISEATVDTMYDALGFSYISYLSVDDGTLVSLARRGFTQQGISLPLNGTGITVKAANTKRSALVNNLSEHPDFVKGSLDSLSELAVPVVLDGVSVAVLNAESPQTNRFTVQDQRLLETLAMHVASAIERIEHEKTRQHLEDEMLEVERIREMERLRSNFIASVSHELRTPLNSIIGFSDLLLMGYSGDITDEQEQNIAQIKRGGETLLNFINALLDLQKLEAGAVKIDPQTVDVNALVSSVVEELRPLAKRKDLYITVDSPEKVRAELDPERIKQVLRNLLSNAVKFTDRGGVVVYVDERDDLLFSIRDTGLGIPEDKLPQVFDRFAEIDPTIRARYGGTGLGLRISKEIVDLHGGKIWVESRLGEGSTFHFQIPLKAPQNG